MKSKQTRRAVHIPEEMYQRIKALAEKNGTSMSAVLEAALAEVRP